MSLWVPVPRGYGYSSVKQPFQVHGIASWPAVVHTHSPERTSARGLSPGLGGGAKRYPALASPLHSHRSLHVPADAGRRQPVRTGGHSSCNSSPKRKLSGLQHVRLEPVQPLCVPRPASMPGTSGVDSMSKSHRPSLHSSMPSAQAPVPTMPVLRAQSAGALAASVERMPSAAAPGTPLGIESMPTLSASGPAAAPPWAQVVLQPQTARRSAEPKHIDVRVQLEQIQQTLQSLPNHMRQMQADELEQTTRQRLENLESTVQFQQMEMQEHREVKEELRAQLVEVETRLQESLKCCSQEAEDHERTRLDLKKAQQTSESALLENEQLKLDHKTTNDQSGIRIQQLMERCTELEKSEQEFEEKVRVMSGISSSLETQVSERERELEGRLTAATDASRRLEAEKRTLEAELDKVKRAQQECEQESRELRCRGAALDDKLREVQERRQRHEQEQEKAEQHIQEWHHKFTESSKENIALQRANQDYKRDLWGMENQLRQERITANMAKPGELLKLTKAHEGESLAADNSRLKKMLTRTQCDLDLCIRKLKEHEKLAGDRP